LRASIVGRIFDRMLEVLHSPEFKAIAGTIAATAFVAVFNYVTKPRTPDELSKFAPRTAAFFRFMNAVFPDPDKAIEAIWQAWNNTRDRNR
jgi:hypothetical protein